MKRKAIYLASAALGAALVASGSAWAQMSPGSTGIPYDPRGPYDTSRVEEGRGVASKRVPFPLPAHQTGRADFPHPAFRLASS